MNGCTTCGGSRAGSRTQGFDCITPCDRIMGILNGFTLGPPYKQCAFMVSMVMPQYHAIPPPDNQTTIAMLSFFIFRFCYRMLERGLLKGKGKESRLWSCMGCCNEMISIVVIKMCILKFAVINGWANCVYASPSFCGYKQLIKIG